MKVNVVQKSFAKIMAIEGELLFLLGTPFPVISAR